MTNQELIEAAIADARKICETAIAATPEEYRSFIRLLPQRKRVGGDKKSPMYATIELPYMQVDGRVKMARDEHLEKEKLLNISTEFVTEPITGQLLCRAIVESGLHGTVTAHARVFLGAQTGADATNPIECGETSALGRALGFLGYGLFGTGIASAEEVTQAQGAARENGPVEKPQTPPSTPPPTPAALDPETRQRYVKRLYALAKEQGIRGEDIEAFCHIMSGTSRTVWTVADFQRYGGDGPEGLKGKSLAEITTLCQQRLADLLYQAQVTPEALATARKAFQLPTLDQVTLPQMAKLAGWARNLESMTTPQQPTSTPAETPQKPTNGDNGGNGAQQASIEKMLLEIDASRQEVTAWEADFLESMLERLADGKSFTAKQGNTIRELHKKLQG